MRREALRIFDRSVAQDKCPYQMLPYQQGLGSMPPAQMLAQRSSMRHKTISALVAHSA
jgi:hypothetical protein